MKGSAELAIANPNARVRMRVAFTAQAFGAARSRVTIRYGIRELGSFDIVSDGARPIELSFTAESGVSTLRLDAATAPGAGTVATGGVVIRDVSSRTEIL